MPIDTFFAFVGVYDDLEDAKVDYEAIKDLHTEANLIDAYDAALVERRADAHDADAVFEMASTYYRAEVSDDVGRTRLDDYERELGLIPVWTTPAAALAAHEVLLASGTAPPWTARETQVLRLLLAGEL